MITVLEAIKLSTEYLSKKGIDSPRINAELLLADIIACKRLDLYLAFDRPLTDTELNEYREFIKRRANFEPLQYITGKVEFYGLELKVNSSVLIPRQETELLVENILNNFLKEADLNILDIGTGSGNIAIALAYHLPSSQIISTDISNEALTLAQENASKHNLSGRIKFIQHDILNDDMDIFPEFDLVVSNPPYVSAESFIASSTVIIWQFNTGNRIKMEPAIDDQNLFIGNLNGDFFCIDKFTGAEKWKVHFNGILNSTPLVTENMIILPNVLFAIHLIDKTDGRLLKSVSLEGRAKLSPVIHKNILFIGFDDGVIRAYDFVNE